MFMKTIDLKTYFEWDTISWSRSLKIWEKHLRKRKDCLALEIGSRGGGLSLMLAKEFEIKVICSDLTSPEKTASVLHEKHNTKHKIQYNSVDCTRINYNDNVFDVVIFKSVIGALGSFEIQKTALNEIFRILKPGGVLLFAENMEASLFHMFLRKKFNRWSTYWRYPKLSDMQLFLKEYQVFEIGTTGFFATMVSAGILCTITSYLDMLIEKVVPAKQRYIVYGAAIK